MPTRDPFAAPCGLYCGVCAIHIAHRENNLTFKQRLLALYQGGVPGKGRLPNSDRLTIEDIRCNGCLSDDRFMHCRQCPIRDCAEAKGITGCHRCDEFPCAHIDGFPMAVGKRVILRAVPHRRDVGTARWMQDEAARYACPQCAQPVFRGAVRCNRCKAALDLD